VPEQVTPNENLVFYHAPNSRSGGTLALLEELGVPYELKLVDIRSGAQRRPEYLGVNPMGKVPAITYGDVVVTEQVAIYLYLADQFPAANLAPGLSDPLRGPYLRWLVFYAAAFEPALSDRATNHAPSQSMCPYGDFDTMLATLRGQLAPGPYLLGDRFTAADVLWGMALGWATSFGLVPETEDIAAYVARVQGRSAAVRARETDARLAAEMTQAQPQA
jgi:glutathione S-transferase